jgi:hypothetical protein
MNAPAQHERGLTWLRDMMISVFDGVWGAGAAVAAP